MGEEKVAGAATHSYNVDPSWYIDTGEMDHITSELDKLTFRERYNGHDQVHTASGSGMDIHHVGQSTIHTPCDKLLLKNILHVPDATKSLLFASKLAFDNNAFLEIHPFDFLVKERGTRRTILHGRSRHGLYPLWPRPSSALKQAFGVNKPSTSRWHRRLGHPSSTIVQQILSHNKLPCVKDFSLQLVCDACQKGKSHQLPYHKSTSVSSAPLELIFSDVWGPAVASVGN
jgi:histone deacetylase 1/2